MDLGKHRKLRFHKWSIRRLINHDTVIATNVGSKWTAKMKIEKQNNKMLEIKLEQFLIFILIVGILFNCNKWDFIMLNMHI